MKPTLVVRERAVELWDEVVRGWGDIARTAVRERGYFAVALSGGTTPRDFYKHLAREPGLPWSQTHLFQVDERLVPAESPESNLRLLRATLLSGLASGAAGLHAVRPDTANPTAAADDYEREIREFFQDRQGGDAAFDLVLLGLGADGHTASLFAGSAALKERERLVAAVPSACGRTARVSLTLVLLNRARHVFFLVTGAAKRAVLADVLGGRDDLPAARVRPAGGACVFFADRAAAG